MKAYLILLLAAGTISASAQTSITNWSSGFANGGTVPDNDLNGLADSRDISIGSGYTIGKVELTLNISGGYTGDLYAYLLHDGQMTVLLDRVGTPANSGYGYLDSGFNVTLSDTAAFSIHNYQDHSPTFSGGSVTGTWQPDGGGLSLFQGLDPNGTWSLYLADESGGGVMTLNSWGLNIETVPEPSMLALSILGSVGWLLFLRRK
jgi:subtilisin-like proprotein convertase family protein